MASKNAEHRPKYAYKGPTLRRDKTKGNAIKELQQVIADMGGRYLSINWKKQVVHYLDSKGNKKIHSLTVIKTYGEKESNNRTNEGE